MSTIQDIHALEQSIYDVVQDYIDGDYNEDDVLAIDRRHGEITLTADTREIIKTRKGTEVYLLKELFRAGEHVSLEPDGDKISEVANSWLFLE
jgi:hypothetical protein